MNEPPIAGARAGESAAPAPQATTTCTELTVGDRTGSFVNDSAPRPTAAGGTVLPGTYWLYEQRRYEAFADLTGYPDLLRARLRLSAERFDEVMLADGDTGKVTTTRSGTWVVVGTNLQQTETCSSSDPTSASFAYTAKSVSTPEYTGVELRCSIRFSALS